MHVSNASALGIGVLVTIPLILTWLVIYTAVLTALRRHERD
jgi:hypothetical protein